MSHFVKWIRASSITIGASHIQNESTGMECVRATDAKTQLRRGHLQVQPNQGHKIWQVYWRRGGKEIYGLREPITFNEYNKVVAREGKRLGIIFFLFWLKDEHRCFTPWRNWTLGYLGENSLIFLIQMINYPGRFFTINKW